jgi:Protein of unknown function (DUF3489)
MCHLIAVGDSCPDSEERTGIRFEKERVYGYSGGAKALLRRPLAPRSRRSGARVGEGLDWLGPNRRREGCIMSIKLTDMQLVLLRAAAQCKDLLLVRPPTLKGATARKVASKLMSAGFVKEIKAKASDPIWRQHEGASYALKLTTAGAKAIAVDDAAEPEDDAGGEESATLANRDQAAIPSKLDAKDARPAEAMEPGPAGPSAPRGGSKLARIIALLERDHGATIEELIAATGWLAARPAPR